MAVSSNSKEVAYESRILSGAPKPEPGMTATFASSNSAVVKASTLLYPVNSAARLTFGNR